MPTHPEVNLPHLARELESVFEREHFKWEHLSNVEEYFMWRFELPDGRNGLIGLEIDENLKAPIVTLLFFLGIIPKSSIELLIRLLEVSGDLVNASLSVQETMPPEGKDRSDHLSVQLVQRHYAWRFRPKELAWLIDDLSMQIEVLLTEFSTFGGEHGEFKLIWDD